MIKKRFLLPAAAGALALAIGLAGIWFNQRLPALADFGVPGMDSEAQLVAWAALFPEKGVAALTFRTVLQWMAQGNSISRAASEPRAYIAISMPRQ